MAGLWGRWVPHDEAGEGIDSCAIVTVEANAVVGEVHERMPVILEQDTWGKWLDPSAEVEELKDILEPASAGDWEGYPVGYYTQEDSPNVIKQDG